MGPIFRLFDLFAPFLPLSLPSLDSGEWTPDEVGADTITPAGCFDDDPECDDRAHGWAPEIIDLRAEAATAKYRGSGRTKLGRFPPRKPGQVTALAVHQTGVERPITSKRYHLISAHYVIRADGALLILFDRDVRLYSSNALDRAPVHAVNVEIAGNFEGVDGSGRWYKPEKFGRGRATPEQLRTLRWLIDDLIQCERNFARVLPHRISGRTKRRGKWVPNRPICPGSRVWKCAESHALSRGLSVPEDGETFGGLPVPPEWRSAAWREREGAEA